MGVEWGNSNRKWEPGKYGPQRSAEGYQPSQSFDDHEPPVRWVTWIALVIVTIIALVGINSRFDHDTTVTHGSTSTTEVTANGC